MRLGMISDVRKHMTIVPILLTLLSYHVKLRATGLLTRSLLSCSLIALSQLVLSASFGGTVNPKRAIKCLRIIALSALAFIVALLALRVTWYLVSRSHSQRIAATVAPPRTIAIERYAQDEKGTYGKLIIGEENDVLALQKIDSLPTDLAPQKHDLMTVEKNDRLSEEGSYRGLLKYETINDEDDFILEFGSSAQHLVQIHIRRNSEIDWNALNTIDVIKVGENRREALSSVRNLLFGSPNPLAFPELPITFHLIDTLQFKAARSAGLLSKVSLAPIAVEHRSITLPTNLRCCLTVDKPGSSSEHKGLLDNIHDTIAKAGDDIHNSIGKAADDVHNTIGKVADDVHNTVGKAAGDVHNTVVKAADDAHNTLGKAVDDTKNTLGKAADDAHNTVGKAADDTHDAIGKASDDVHNNLDKAVDDVEATFENIPVLGSLLEPWPLSQFHHCHPQRIVSKLSTEPRPPLTGAAEKLGWATAPFKRIGVSGWVDTGCSARAVGIPVRPAQHSSDDLWTVDVKLLEFEINGVYMPAGRFIRLEVEPGTKAHDLCNSRQLTERDKLSFGGVVLVDSDGPFLEVHPRDEFYVK
jgi:hypothetical protein